MSKSKSTATRAARAAAVREVNREMRAFVRSAHAQVFDRYLRQMAEVNPRGRVTVACDALAREWARYATD